METSSLTSSKRSIGFNIKSLQYQVQGSQQLGTMQRQIVTIISVAILLLVAATTVAKADNHEDQHQPAPEPYSFSYSADSIGGQSSHQETGDAAGRVTGFYTIMGEDGRERRVDYVADENGYRATISTNEIGTRAESSADAQYNVRLPSEKQLEASKVSLEQYKYLEETHTNERQLQLARLSSNKQQQASLASQAWSNKAPQQQQLSSQSSGEKASFQASGSISGLGQINNRATGSYSGAQTVSQTNAGQQQQQLQSSQQASANQGDSLQSGPSLVDSGSSEIDLDWRQRDSTGARVTNQKLSSASINSASWNQGNFKQQQQQPQQPIQPSFAGQSESSFSASSSSSSTGNGAQSNLASSQSENGLLNQQRQQSGSQTANQQRLDGAQQVQVAAWQMASRGAMPARKQTSVLQRQMDLQFMQQLSDQDYPRQTTTTNSQLFQATEVGGAQLGFQLGQQQPQQQLQQPLMNTASQFDGQFSATIESNTGATVLGSRDQLDQQLQQQQQQNNIIDETPDQPDAGVALVGQSGSGLIGQQQTNGQISRSSVTSTSSNIQQQQPTFRPSGAFISSTSTSKQTAPAGFVSINLSKDDATSQQQEDGNQQIGQGPAQTDSAAPTQAYTQFGHSQSGNQAVSVSQQQQMNREEAVDVTSQGDGAGNNNEQLVTTTGAFNSEEHSIKLQQVKGQQQETFVPTSTPATIQLRPTTFASLMQTTTNANLDKVELGTRLTTPIETTTARQVYSQPSTTTTTTSTTTTEQPASEATYTQNDGQTANKEVNRFQQQQQVKGGFRVQSNRFDRPSVSSGFGVPAKTNQFSWQQQQQLQTASTTTDKPKDTSGYTYQSDDKQSTYYSTSQPGSIQPMAAKVMATSGFQQANAVNQQQSAGNQWQQTMLTTQPSRVEFQPQQQQQQQLKGTKGGSLRRKQQFWQQSSAPRSQQQAGVGASQGSAGFPSYGSRVVAKRS